MLRSSFELHFYWLNCDMLEPELLDFRPNVRVNVNDNVSDKINET